MERKLCCKCQKPIDTLGHRYIRIQEIQNTYSQGYPDEFVARTFESCPLCTLNALKIALIGDTQEAHDKFDHWVEK